jgi:hypothetical protein
LVERRYALRSKEKSVLENSNWLQDEEKSIPDNMNQLPGKTGPDSGKTEPELGITEPGSSKVESESGKQNQIRVLKSGYGKNQNRLRLKGSRKSQL